MKEFDLNHPLAGFIFEASSGAAIKHLADKGYSATEISERLDYPTPMEKIRETIWTHYIETGVICLEKPDRHVFEKVDYIKVTNEYGRSSFKRQVTNVDESQSEYVTCDFGVRLNQDMDSYLEYISVLSKSDQDYILGISWPDSIVYHKLNSRMEGIVTKLKM